MPAVLDTNKATDSKIYPLLSDEDAETEGHDFPPALRSTVPVADLAPSSSGETIEADFAEPQTAQTFATRRNAILARVGKGRVDVVLPEFR